MEVNDIPTQLAVAFSLYSVLIDIVSIVNFPTTGWKIYGDKIEEVRRGITIGIFGEQKSGKTFCASCLLDHSLGSNKIINTRGLGLWLPPKNGEVVTNSGDNSNSSNNNQQEDDTINDGFSGDITNGGRGVRGGRGDVRGGRGGRGDGRGRKPTTKIMTPYDPVKSKEESQLIIIDFAGTNAPCAEQNLDDLQCTENLLRRILLTISKKFIYVTSKFLRTSQMEINNIVNEVNSSMKEIQKIDAKNRLFVIHNLIEATTEEVLNIRVMETRNVYESVVYEDKSVPSWEEMNDKPTGCKYYTTPYFAHIFLVNQPEENKDLNENEKWRLNHNKNAFDFIRNHFYAAPEREQLDLVKAVASCVEKELSIYTNDYDDSTMQVVVDYQFFNQPTLFPIKKKEGDPTVVFKETPIDPSRYLDTFELKDLQFLANNRFFSNDEFKGTVFDLRPQGKKEFLIKVEMPGVRDKNSIQIKRRQASCRIFINAKTINLQEEEKECQYVAQFSANCTFSMTPTIEELKAKSTLEYGVFSCFIAIHEDD